MKYLKKITMYDEQVETTASNSSSPVLIKIVPTQNPCKHHKTNTMGYVERHEWADRKIKQGHKQSRCKDCGRWYFKCEM